MEALKLVISGPVGSGKTTLAQSLLGEAFLDTEARTTENLGKATTTVALDFGVLRVGAYPVHLFGTPGQERFSFMWDILMEGALGLLVLVAGDRPEHLPQARYMLEHLTTRHPVPYLVGVTRLDLPKAWSPEEVALYLRLPEERVLGLDPRRREEALRTVERLLQLALKEVEGD